KSGLAVGERLVVDGLQRVKVGDTVKVQEVSLQRPGRSANGQGGQGAGEGKGGNAPQADPATSAAPASTAAAASATR
ncbi:MAG: efflux transporter periplasmic adaptor subunit, partial [Burkholderiaceae bacterium]|nr:efflux transporter periplasmic adaptor subunit [Burkholderiaceae bacterium]